MVALSRNIPRKNAFEMLTTGKFIETEEAARLGLINRAVPHDQLESATRELADTVASKLTAAVKNRQTGVLSANGTERSRGL